MRNDEKDKRVPPDLQWYSEPSVPLYACTDHSMATKKPCGLQ